MRNQPTPKIHRKRHCVWLYSAVFSGRISVLAVLLLCGSFLTQPFHEAIAAEPVEAATEEPETIAVDVKEQEEPAPAEEDAPSEVTDEDSEQSSENESQSNDSDSETNDVSNTEEASGQNQTESSGIAETDTAGSSSNSSSTTTTPQTGSESTQSTASSSGEPQGQNTQTNGTSASSTETASSTQQSESDENTQTATSSDSSSGGGASDSEEPSDTEETPDETNDDSAPESDSTTEEEPNTSGDSSGGDGNAESENESEVTDSASTSEETSAEADEDVEPVELNYSINNQNFYQFSKQSCIAVGDGTYHCTERSESDIDRSTAVYADVGASGNLEIYMQTADGEVEQLTDNNRDDTAPHFDPDSMQIVWQRMVDSRYQIILYDLQEREETQLTFSRTNNMEPKVSKDGIVWQAWDNNDWEIMYFDGTYTDQITDNFAQDVTPAIQDGYIVWSVLGQDEQLARVYSLDTGETMSISGHEGGTIANPRFVLVYDTQFDNGDVITQGFDPETGLAKPISAQPGPNPVNVPEPDTTGETIALIQNKGSSKDEKERVVVSAEGGPDPDFSTSTASTTDTLNLNAPDFEPATSTVDIESEDSATTTPATAEEFELTEFDLVILRDGEEVISTSTPEEIPMMERADVDAEVASSTQ